MYLFLRALRILALCLLGVVPAGTALASSADDSSSTLLAKIHLQAGVAHFNAGEYADAEREMLRAYSLRHVPELKYNLAQCQERLGALDRALVSYQEYLRDRPDAPDALEVQRRTASLQERIKSGALPKPPASAEPPPASAVVSEPAPSAPAPAEKVIFKEIIVYKVQQKAGRNARNGAFGVLGLALAGLATGIVFTVNTVQFNQSIAEQDQVFQAQFGLSTDSCIDSAKVQQAVNNRANQDAMTIGGTNTAAIAMQLVTSYQPIAMNLCDFNRIAHDNAKLNVAGTVVGYSVGGIALAGALGLFLYGRKLDKQQAQEARQQSNVPNLSFWLQPAGGQRGAGLALSGSF